MLVLMELGVRNMIMRCRGEHTRLTASALGLLYFRMIDKLLENPPPFGAVGNIKT